MGRKELAEKIAAFARTAEEHVTPVPGLTLFRRTIPTACYRAMCEPSLTVFVQGRKRIDMAGEQYLGGGGSFLLSSIDVPVRSQIVEASEEVPLLSMLLKLDLTTVREVLSRDDLPEPSADSQRRGVAIGHVTEGLLSACKRLSSFSIRPKTYRF